MPHRTIEQKVQIDAVYAQLKPSIGVNPDWCITPKEGILSVDAAVERMKELLPDMQPPISRNDFTAAAQRFYLRRAGKLKPRPEESEVVIGGRYRYYMRPTEYTVTEVVLDATYEERTNKLEPTVVYTQEVAGIYPEGTRYSRRLSDFLSQVNVDGIMVNKFELIAEES